MARGILWVTESIEIAQTFLELPAAIEHGTLPTQLMQHAERIIVEITGILEQSEHDGF